jgi:hypothetical protein
MLAPGDEDFYREAGRFAGRVERQLQGYQPMVRDPATAMRLGPKIWSSFFDAGRLEVEMAGALEGSARVLDFEVSPVLCERTCGAWEGLLSTAELRADVTEQRCVHRGDDCCEFRVVWTPI